MFLSEIFQSFNAAFDAHTFILMCADIIVSVFDLVEGQIIDDLYPRSCS
jgi:hypothetical protein